MNDAATPPPAARRSRRAGAAGERAATFDEFYKDSRDRLLVQTIALTGDVSAARSAVRDAFVVSWHHWRKIARQERPEDVVRGYAYRFGLRRRSARPFARRKDGDESVRATLEALASISLPQRKAVILTQLAGVDMAQAAREIGVPVENAERELAAGAALFAHDRQVPTGHIHQTLVGLEALAREVTWPRPTIIRRAGSARRRAHTLVGATAAVAVFAAAGVIVTDGSGLRPTLDRDARRAAAARSNPDVTVSLPPSTLVEAADLTKSLAHSRGRHAWTQDSTGDNSTGNGLVQPCQRMRYADRRGAAALVRQFHSGHGSTQRGFVQSTEASTSTTAAQRTYSTALSWFTACRTPAGQDPTKLPLTHLVSTAVVPGLGDQAAMVVLHTEQPRATYVVGLARSGLYTTAASLRTDDNPGRADRDGVARLLGAAVDKLCALPDGGGCSPAKIKVTESPVFPVGTSSALLAEIDVPAIGLRHGRLVGTKSRKVSGESDDTSVLGCDAVHLVGSYRGAKIHSNLVHSFVFVDSDLPKETGLTQVVGSLPTRRAEIFPDQMAQQIAKCPGRNASMGTEVARLVDESTKRTDLRAWRLTTELAGGHSVEYDVAIVRSGGALSQIIYVSAPAARMADRDFVDVARRALERLAELPAYGKG